MTPATTSTTSAPRTALVLGGGSEIAAACVSELSRRGLSAVHLGARDPETAVALLQGASEGLAISCDAWDATDTASHEPLIAAAADAMGRIDLVICAVGLLGHHAGIDSTPAEVDAMVRTNFAGPAAALAAVGAHMGAAHHGTIVVLSSVAAIRARRSNYVYGSSKAGLDTFAQGLGDALAPRGARVVVVRPGFVTSKMTRALQPAPFHTDPATVATAVADALGHRRDVVAVPRVLGPLFAVLRSVPRPLWRRIAGDR